MRIQHNIMAMNAYRNYSSNTKALAKNLEKLSSGYKINRAGDDAAGLAISEKMRAQITGLKTAQKNSKDGISLVQTAEGALTEVHDMLNRMFDLAEQSSNGTYDNAVDRANLQKEINSLKAEINRIADSVNFNGLNLLDGSLGGAVIKQNNVGELVTPQTVPQPSVGAPSNWNSTTDALTIDVTFSSIQSGTKTTVGDRQIVWSGGGAASADAGVMPLAAAQTPSYDGKITIGSDANKTLTVDLSKYKKSDGTVDSAAMLQDVAAALNDSGGVTVGGQTFKVETDATKAAAGALTLKSATPNNDGTWTDVMADAAATTMANNNIKDATDFTNAVKETVKTDKVTESDLPQASGIFTAGAATVGHGATVDAKEIAEFSFAKDFTIAENDQFVIGGKLYTFKGNASGDNEIAFTDGNLETNLKALGAKLAGSDYDLAYTVASGENGPKLTLTAKATGEKADLAAVAKVGAKGSATVGSVSFKAGTAGTATPATLAIDLNGAGLKAGDKITIGGQEFTIEGDTAKAQATALQTAILTNNSLKNGIEAGDAKGDGIVSLKTTATGASGASAVISGLTSATALTGERTITVAGGSVYVAGSNGTASTLTIDLGSDIKAGDKVSIAGTEFTLSGEDATAIKNDLLTQIKAHSTFKNSLDANTSTVDADGKIVLTTSATSGGVAIGDFSGSDATSDLTITRAVSVASDKVAPTAGADGTPTSAELTIDLTGVKAGTVVDIGGEKLVLRGADATEMATNLLADIKANNTLKSSIAESSAAANGVLTLKSTATGSTQAADLFGMKDASGVATYDLTKAADATVTQQGSAAGQAQAGTVEFSFDYSKIKEGSKIVVDGRTYVFSLDGATTKAGENETLVDLSTLTTEHQNSAGVADALKTAIDGYQTANPTASHNFTATLSQDGSNLVLTEKTAGTYRTEGDLKNAVVDVAESRNNGGESTVDVGNSPAARPAMARADDVPGGDATTDQRGTTTITMSSNARHGDTITVGEGDKAVVFEFVKAQGDALKNENAVAVVLGKDSTATLKNLSDAMKTTENAAKLADAGATAELSADGKTITLTNGLTDKDANDAAPAVKSKGGGLTLQIGDTADEFNKLVVSIADMHAEAMGIGDVDIGSQDGASEAMAKIKSAINYVSGVRGDLGATQNRLEHTINNLSVMQENIQDAEASIRDVDIAEEMMAYTKNNILVQSAQAMLAQANQLPQGVLQLLQ